MHISPRTKCLERYRLLHSIERSGTMPLAASCDLSSRNPIEGLEAGRAPERATFLDSDSRKVRNEL